MATASGSGHAILGIPGVSFLSCAVGLAVLVITAAETITTA